MAGAVFPVRRAGPRDLCEHCGELVDRVWLVPGDVLDSCAACFVTASGRPPVHEHGHSSGRARPQVERELRPAATFYLRVDGRRPA